MKKYNIIKFIYTLIVLCFIVTSCETTRETYEDFLVNEDAFNVGKAVGLIAEGGNLRAELKVIINSDPKITKIEVEVLKQDGLFDVQSFDFVRKSSKQDTVKVVLDNLDEGNRLIKVTLLDKNNKRSLVERTSVRVFGSAYQSGLVTRTYSLEAIVGGDINIVWDSPFAGILTSNLTYTKKNGDIINEVITNDITTTDLAGIDLSKEINVTSEYLPENGLDKFNSAAINFTYPTNTGRLNLSLISPILLNNDIVGNHTKVFPNTWDNNPGT